MKSWAYKSGTEAHWWQEWCLAASASPPNPVPSPSSRQRGNVRPSQLESAWQALCYKTIMRQETEQMKKYTSVMVGGLLRTELCRWAQPWMISQAEGRHVNPSALWICSPSADSCLYNVVWYLSLMSILLAASSGRMWHIKLFLFSGVGTRGIYIKQAWSKHTGMRLQDIHPEYWHFP